MDRYLHIRPSNQLPDESMTSSEPTNQREAAYIMGCFELVKVISHQCVIFGRYNSSIRTVGSALRGISWETSMIFAASRLQSWMTTELNRHLVWSSTASPSKQRRHRWVDPDNCDQQVYYILSTVIHLTSFERWTEFWKLNWVCAYKRSSTSIITYLTNNCRLIDVTSLERRRHQLYLYYSLFFILYLFIIISNLSLLSHLGHHTSWSIPYRLGDRFRLPYMIRCCI